MKFAHMADIHLGAHRQQTHLQKRELEVFTQAMQECIDHDVDFILISGDFFHVGIPDLGIVNGAVRQMREVQKKGIPIYVIYGSHDYTPSGTSVIDILDTIGLVTNIEKRRMEDGKLKLDFFTDPKTGAKLAGIAARQQGLESEYYEVLDRKRLEDESGFKIFAFHSGLNEFKPKYLSEMKTIPISNFPKGFDYYAGGHIHKRGEYKSPGYDKIIFPGPLFTGHGFKDIADTAQGEGRGFYVVSFDDKVRDVEFVKVKSFDGIYRKLDVKGKTSIQADSTIQRELTNLDVNGKVVILKIEGELSGGKTSDIKFLDIKSNLDKRGASQVYYNRYGLTSKEYSDVRVMGEDVSSIETKVFQENLGSESLSHFPISQRASAAEELLRALRHSEKSNENVSEYKERMTQDGIEVLKLKKMFEDGEQ